MPTIKKAYVQTGRIQVAFHHYPLPMHGLARGAAVATECAARSGRFWEMHDALFADPTRLAQADLVMRAGELGLDEVEFARCAVSGGPAAARVQAAIDHAADLPIGGTPTFFVGRRLDDGKVLVTQKVSGLVPQEQFRLALDAVLSEVDQGSQNGPRQRN